MFDVFLHLSAEDRVDALATAAAESGRPAHLLEKDVWVVWALRALFEVPLGEGLVFKGGTSLSKAYDVIQRFSEDIDLTYDIRRLLPDLAGAAEDPVPETRAEERRWTREVERLLPLWVEGEVRPMLEARLAADGVAAAIRIEGAKAFIDYAPTSTGTGYVSPSVMLEFGARATGEPSAPRPVVCDAAAHLAGVEFPTAMPRVMAAERTFWEKATAAHVYCAQGRLRGDRFSRHWHDLARLDAAGFAETAIADRAVAEAVARHKAMFFRATADGEEIDYGRAIAGGLRLKPEGASLEALGDDYRRMVEDGLLEADAEPFEALMAACADLARRANAGAAA
ncbi:nucleotidyl transferase AbiEii/AbiGii toxin family protein [Brevundimonas sp. GCM10030266]|uniref:nucleotidyl transferase AbiEii/AbiGii toxin family protein n=1 Tax=Brevundimonas sp. GCM10030266 TaxID=3273386 RepID=UPI003624067A